MNTGDTAFVDDYLLGIFGTNTKFLMKFRIILKDSIEIPIHTILAEMIQVLSLQCDGFGHLKVETYEILGRYRTVHGIEKQFLSKLLGFIKIFLIVHLFNH